MSLIYITGMSGSGKSTVMEELRGRDYDAHGTDEHGFGKWVNKETKAVDTLPEDEPNFDIHKWFSTHDWTLDDVKIKKLKKDSDKSKKIVLLCGVANGEDKVWHLFDKVIALIVDEKTLRRRISSRTNNDFGKTEEELSHILDWHKGYEKAYRGYGATLIDANRPVERVVDDIIKLVGSTPTA